MAKPLHDEWRALALAAPEVILRRSLRLAAQQPGNSREWQRMHVEKFEAAQDGAFAMMLETMRLQQHWFQLCWRTCMAPWMRQPAFDWPAEYDRAAKRILAEGIAPARKRAVANVRRLRRS